MVKTHQTKCNESPEESNVNESEHTLSFANQCTDVERTHWNKVVKTSKIKKKSTARPQPRKAFGEITRQGNECHV